MLSRRKMILGPMIGTSTLWLCTGKWGNRLFAAQPNVVVEKPSRSTLEDLRTFDDFARENFALPRYLHPGVGSLGLILSKLGEGRYDWCTPLNCLPFARTGGNGVHFSFLTRDEKLVSRTPVIMTNPGGGDGRSWIVGSDLHDFLSFGYHCGYFVMEQLAYSLEKTLATFVSPESPEADKDLLISEEKAPVMKAMRERLGLKPWETVNHFQELQDKFAGQMKYPPGLTE